MLDENDVSPDSSSEAEQQPADSSPSEEASGQAAPQQAKEDNVPFHQHPRFQELIAERRAIKEQNETFQRELQELRQQMKQSQPQQQSKDELMERLKGIDPVFAERFGKLSELDAVKQELAEMKAWRDQTSAQTVQQTVQSSKEKFYSDHKVPAEHREFYEAQVLLEAQKNPQLRASDLPQVLKGVHERVSKLLTSTQREATKQLVENKQAAAAKPATQPKGVPAKAASGDKGPKNKAELRAEMAKDILAEIRAAKNT